jgi:TfoX/Sxy family transcriptional regulator of competence genes
MPKEGSMHWDRSSPELTARFDAMAAAVPGLERRKMFGEVAGFVSGNMVTGLHAGRWFVRLPPDVRAEALALDGAKLFEPMPGRPMTEYVSLPADIVADDAAVGSWMARAVAYGGTLKPKR